MDNLSIPNVPTDTLYKFMTIFGLIMLIVSFSTPIISFKDSNLKRYDLSYQIAKTEFYHSIVNREVAKLDSTISKLELEFLANKTNDLESDKSISLLRKHNFDALSKMEVERDSVFMMKQQLEHLTSYEKQIFGYCNQGIFLDLFSA